MLIIAHHDVSDIQGFWAAAEQVTKSLPSNLKIHGVYPSTDGKTGTCLWEAKTVAEVQEFLDKNAGPFAKNYCYEVNVEKSIGLPVIQLSAAQLS
jgi:hypothetical protein